MKVEARPAVIALAREGARLSGPSCEHDVHQLAAALHAESPWMRDVSAWIMTQMLLHVAGGGHGLSFPPFILAGALGVGKSHYARTLARLAGVPARMIDVGGGSAGFRISGTEKGWSTEQPGIPVETILATRIANPVIIVDEIDKATTTYGTRGASSSLTTSLLQMLEGTTAAHFECLFYRLPFNMSRVVWVLIANDADLIPAPLRDRSRVFHIPKLSVIDAVAYFDRLTACNEPKQEHDRCRDFIAAMCARPDGISLRQIGQLAGALAAPTTVITH